MIDEPDWKNHPGDNGVGRAANGPWSWACKCGAFSGGIFDIRKRARRDYRRHKKVCPKHN